MNIFDRLPWRAQGAQADTAVQEAIAQRDSTIIHLEERIAELETDERGYQRLGGSSDNDFSRDGLRSICRRSRLFWLHNPLIKRGVFIRTSYVHGQGVNVQAKDRDVNAVVQAFMDDAKNQAELTSLQALIQQEDALQVDANLFFTFFTNRRTGAVRVRSIPFDEIEDIITNPDDAREPWYYKRVRTKRWFDVNRGDWGTKRETTYHPDWRYKPTGGFPRTVGGDMVMWEAPVFHVAVNKLPDMKFGVSEVYAALDWAKAYKEFLENWATIVRSHARFAWEVKTSKGGKTGPAVTASKMEASARGTSTTPPAGAGAAFVAAEGQSITPIKTAGATTSADDGRRLLLMVCAGLGIYEHYFGDPSSGNLATATSMERPMLLMFKARQRFWQDTLQAILRYAIEQSARSPGGTLAGRAVVTRNEWGEEAVDFGDFDTHIDVDFPDLLEADVQTKVNAIIAAGTLNGQSPAGLDLKTITRMLLVALGEDDVDQLIDQLFPENWEEARAEKAAKLMQAAQSGLQAKQDQAAEDGEDGLSAKEARTYAELTIALRDLAEAARETRDAA